MQFTVEIFPNFGDFVVIMDQFLLALDPFEIRSWRTFAKGIYRNRGVHLSFHYYFIPFFCYSVGYT